VAIGLMLLILALWLRPSTTLPGRGSSTAASPPPDAEAAQQQTAERAPRQVEPVQSTTSPDAPWVPAKPTSSGPAPALSLGAGQLPGKQSPDTQARAPKPVASSLQAGLGHPDGEPSASPPGLFVEPDF
jgi:hypothetical protein